MPIDDRDTLLVYRDRIVPRSEAQFLRRLYIGFRRLKPVWVGRRTDDGLAELGVQPLILGRAGAAGVVEREVYKHLGILPARPDLAALRPRLLHAHFGRGGTLALPMARRLQIPLVVTYHGGDATKHTHYRRRLLPTLYQRRLAALQEEAALFICVSDFIREQLLERGFPPEKLRVIRYGVEIEEEAPEDRPPPSGILFVGRFVEKKGIEHLVAAMRLLAARGREIPLTLIGDGPLAGAVRQQTAALRQVTLPGWLPNDEVRRRMRGALAVCVPSTRAPGGDAEGLPNVVLEAMAAGVPVIGSRHAGIEEAVADGRTGLLVPPGDAATLAAAIERLLDDPAAQAAMGVEARATATARFSAVAQSRVLEDTLLALR